MVYLSSPEGGRTVFPGQGLEEEAVEGDALLWHGMRADQKKDARGLHLACPVLAGGRLSDYKQCVEISGSFLVRKQVDGEPGSELARGLGGISQGGCWELGGS